MSFIRDFQPHVALVLLTTEAPWMVEPINPRSVKRSVSLPLLQVPAVHPNDDQNGSQPERQTLAEAPHLPIPLVEGLPPRPESRRQTRNPAQARPSEPRLQYRGSSKYKGVSWSDRSSKWRAQMWFGNKVGTPAFRCHARLSSV